jgi:diguanylate cyclase (GGDEF)-like protein
MATGALLIVGMILFIFGQFLGLKNTYAFIGPFFGLIAGLVIVFGKKSLLPILVVLQFLNLVSALTGTFEQKSQILLSGALVLMIVMIQAYCLRLVLARILLLHPHTIFRRELANYFALMANVLIGSAISFYAIELTSSQNRINTIFFIGLVAISQFIGAIISIPLVEVVFATDRKEGLKKFKTIVMPLWISVLVLSNAFYLWDTELNKRISTEINKLNTETISLIEGRLQEQEIFIESVQSLFAASKMFVTPRQFESFTERGLRRYPMVQAISWAPVIKSAELGIFIRDTRRYYPEFSVVERNNEGKFEKVKTRNIYIPVEYIEPFEINKKAQGFDLYSNPIRADAIDRAMISNHVVASAPIRLVQETKQQAGLLLLKFLSESSNGPGLVSEVLRFEDFISTVANPSEKNIYLKIKDADTDSILFEKNRPIDLTYVLNAPIVFGGRVYDIETSPGPVFLAANDSNKLRLLFGALSALVITFISTFLSFIYNVNLRIEDKVSIQTAEISEKEQQLRYVLNATGDGIWDWNILTGEVRHNPRWITLLDEDPNQKNFTVEDFSNRIHPADRGEVFDKINACLVAGKVYHHRYRMMRLDGREIWVEDRGAVVEWSESGEPIRMVGAINDIGDQKASQEKIEELIYFDSLTKLPNRHYIQDQIIRAVKDCQRNKTYSGLLYLDLDNFKVVNDTFGHYVGDILLKEFGMRIQKTIGPKDIVSRIGGDEFLILFEEIDSTVEGARSALGLHIEKILKEFNQNFDLGDGIYVHAEASIGAVIFGDHVNKVEEILKFADLAMYAAKKDSQKRYRLFDASLIHEFNEKNDYLARLKKACNLGQIYALYQPVVNRNQEVVAYEALARWDDPELGAVRPDEFIHFAESNGLIIELGNSILKNIFSHPLLWKDSEGAKKLILMINISTHQLMNLGFAQQFIRACEDFHVPMDRLHIEITESVYLENIENAIDVMGILRARGVKFALDDFGTGYSSFSYLQKLPIDYLKVDQSFVLGIGSNSEAEAIVAKVLELAQILKLKVIAEGVETKVQFDWLYERNCDFFQGWYFGKPSTIINI